MPTSVIDFVCAALRSGMECSIEDLRRLPEYESMGALDVVKALETVCRDAKLNCSPPLNVGELDDRRVFSSARSANEFEEAFESACQLTEGQRVEFKQTLGLNVNRLKNDPKVDHASLFDDEMIHEVIKTIIAFLNADGGTLIIGLCDDGERYGIENEFPYVGGKHNLDQWELRLNAALQAYIPDYRIIIGYVKYAIVHRDGSTFCVVLVDQRRDRISVCRRSNKEGAEELVYRRSGNQSPKLQARDIEALVIDKFRTR